MKAKILILAILVAFATNALFSQDVIIKNDKSEIKAKVIEIQENSIKYKLFESLEGPIRNISTSDVFMIIYEDGKRETFGTVEEKPVQLSQEVSAPSSYYPLRVFARVSLQDWNNSEISDYYGSNVLLGGGVEKQLSDDFKVRGDFDFGSSVDEGYTLTYTQLGVSMKYAWYPFGSNRPNVCGGLGIKSISLKEAGDGDIEKGSSFGFSALLGIEIPLGKKVLLDLGWDTVWSKMNYDGSNINVGSEIFYGGIIFSLW